MMQNNQEVRWKNIALWLSLFVFFLTALQRARIQIGPMPLYFTDVFLGLLFLKGLQIDKFYWTHTIRKILFIAKFYFLFVVLGEIRGAISYNFILPGIYQIARYGLGISRFTCR